MDSPSPGASPRSPRSPGGSKPRLTEGEKKANHIKSEQKRREAIRIGFDQLSSMVPGLEGCGRSEAKVLDGAVVYMQEQLERRKKLLEQAKANGIDTTNYELSPSLGEPLTPIQKRGVPKFEESPPTPTFNGSFHPNGNGIYQGNGNGGHVENGTGSYSRRSSNTDYI